MQAIDTYTVSNYKEPLESMLMDRTRLKGRTDILFDRIPSHRSITNAPGVSACFQVPLSPDFKIKFISFPKSAFKHPLDVATLAAYLNGLSLKFEKQHIEVLEYPEVTTGRSKFRILGQRALTLRYSLDIGEQRITRGENWVQHDDMIHIVVVEAPSPNFDGYYQDARRYLKSMRMFSSSE